MKLINEFVEKVLNNNGTFTMEFDEDRKYKGYYHFMQSNVGKARYIYGMRSYNNDKFYSDICLKPELIAIVSDGIVFVVDEYFLRISYSYKNVLFPENATRFDTEVKAKNQYVKDVIFPDFYNSLEVEEFTDTYTIEECKNHAREYLFSKVQHELLDDEKIDDLFKDQDVANMLCGFMDLKEEAEKRLEEKKDDWIYKKSKNQKIRELIKDPETAAEWEIKLAEGIRSVEAKTVLVEFEMNNVRASGKMNPDVIRRVLKTNDTFSRYNFAVAKQGEQIFSDLGVDNWNDKKSLRCEHIVKITYGKKELYVREQ